MTQPPIATILADFATDCRTGLSTVVRTDALGRALDVVGNALAATELLDAVADFHDEAVADPARRALAHRISVLVDDTCDREFPHAFSAPRVRTRDARHWEQRTHSSRGGPEHPLTEAELATKFTLNATRALPAAATTAVAAAVAALPEQDHVGPLVLP